MPGPELDASDTKIKGSMHTLKGFVIWEEGVNKMG